MKYKLIHRTTYEYQVFVNGYHSLACLCPKTTPTQLCSAFTLTITPTPAELVQRTDFFGNTIHYFSIQQPHKELHVVAESIVENLPAPPPLQGKPSMSCAEARRLFQVDQNLRNELLQFMLPSPFIHWEKEIENFAKDSFPENRPLFEAVQHLCTRIFREFEFMPDATTIHTPILSVLKDRKGVCQDFSHVALAAIRSMGFAARYVSGYLETKPPPGAKKLQGSDASHAWISAYVPGLGWCDFDPTNNVIPGLRHITTAWGRDYSDVPPLKGILFSSGKQKLKVAVDVLPLEGE